MVYNNLLWLHGYNALTVFGCTTEQTPSKIHFGASIIFMVSETKLIKYSLGILEMSHLTLLNLCWISTAFINWRHNSFWISCQPAINSLVNWSRQTPEENIEQKMYFLLFVYAWCACFLSLPLSISNKNATISSFLNSAGDIGEKQTLEALIDTQICKGGFDVLA